MSPTRVRPRFLDTHEHPYPKHAKIVATLGPASEAPEMLEKLIKNGVNVFRLNFSHGSLDEQLVRLKRVREAAIKTRTPVGVLGDLQGPKMRVTKVPDLDGSGGLMLETGQDIVYRPGVEEAFLGADGDDFAACFGVTFDPMFTDVEVGQRILVNDGAIRMLIVDHKPGEEVRCRITHGGKISSSKGVNLPETDLQMPAITPRDWECVEWGVEHGIDCFALSFVRTAEEVIELKTKLKGMCSIDPERGSDPLAHDIPVITKVEKPQALDNLAAIVQATDGVMVARGDLGVEMDTWHVPVAQKHIVEMCADYGKPCIVATQMLATMSHEPMPTRAEASDVANAIFDGADAVMLSGETAVGKHPDLVVETMNHIIRSAEDWIDQQPHEPHAPRKLEDHPHRSASMAAGAWHIATRTKAKLVVVWSQTGGMARYLSQHDFRVPILAYTSSRTAARRMAFFGGVTPIRCDIPDDGLLSTWTDIVAQRVREEGWGDDGDAIVMIAGKPLGGTTTQDILGILRLGDPDSGFRAHDR